MKLVVHCKKEPYDVLVDRTTIWGNDRLENVRFACPNCHSQTETFGRKNVRSRGGILADAPA